MDGLE